MRHPIIPKLHVPIHIPPGELASLLRQDILQRRLLIEEDIQMVADDMPVLARRAPNQHRAFVVSVLGHVVR